MLHLNVELFRRQRKEQKNNIDVALISKLKIFLFVSYIMFSGSIV